MWQHFVPSDFTYSGSQKWSTHRLPSIEKTMDLTANSLSAWRWYHYGFIFISSVCMVSTPSAFFLYILETVANSDDTITTVDGKMPEPTQLASPTAAVSIDCETSPPRITLPSTPGIILCDVFLEKNYGHFLKTSVVIMVRTRILCLHFRSRLCPNHHSDAVYYCQTRSFTATQLRAKWKDSFARWSRLTHCHQQNTR